MSRILKFASAVAITASTISVLMTEDVGLAYDQIVDSVQEQQAPETEATVDDNADIMAQQSRTEDNEADPASTEIVQPLPEDYVPADQITEAVLTDAASLGELVAMQDLNAPLNEQMRCLAGAVYFESKGESLEGQLAVARVVMARAASSRFPNSYCGVVYQRKQFSFVRGGSMPRIRTGSDAWANARAIAMIADSNAWESGAEGALFFHARYVNPRWRLRRVAQIDNHIFYR
ncbi:MAG: cell wall hydrolase [Pseudomonadota bacterium]